jgi:hypothetical protein
MSRVPAQKAGNCGFYIQKGKNGKSEQKAKHARNEKKQSKMENSNQLFMKESIMFFQEKMIEVFKIKDRNKVYDLKVTGAEDIAKVLSPFSSLGHYLNIDDARTRRGPDAFNSIKLDYATKILQIGRVDEDYLDVFRLEPDELLVHYCPNDAHCIMVLSNKIAKKLTVDDLLVDPEKCEYCDVVETEKGIINDLSNYVNPLLFYAKGSEYIEKKPSFLKDIIAKQELNSLDVKS